MYMHIQTYEQCKYVNIIQSLASMIMNLHTYVYAQMLATKIPLYIFTCTKKMFIYVHTNMQLMVHSYLQTQRPTLNYRA